MRKRKLNYQFHNPNTSETAADYLLKILIEANTKKVDHVIQKAVDCQNEQIHQEHLV